MRIAAGGLLLLSAIFNLIIGIGYLLGGAFQVQLGGVLGGGAEIFTALDAAVLDTVGGPKAFGSFVLVCAAILLGGAISVLFSTLPGVIYSACAVAIFSALFSVALTSIGLASVVGIIGGGLGFISGLRIHITQAANRDGDDEQANQHGIGSWIAVGSILFGLLLVLATIISLME